jgi:hypothetical protein
MKLGGVTIVVLVMEVSLQGLLVAVIPAKQFERHISTEVGVLLNPNRLSRYILHHYCHSYHLFCSVCS